MSYENILQHRSATAADLRQVIGFVRNAQELFFAYPKAVWPLDVGQLAATMAERRENTVVEFEGKVAGFANFFQWHHGESCTLGNLMIDPESRNLGVAQYLIGVMEALAKTRYKAHQLKASCFSANAAGLLLYSHLGYSVESIVERSAQDGSRLAMLQLSKDI